MEGTYRTFEIFLGFCPVLREIICKGLIMFDINGNFLGSLKIRRVPCLVWLSIIILSHPRNIWGSQSPFRTSSLSCRLDDSTWWPRPQSFVFCFHQGPPSFTAKRFSSCGVCALLAGCQSKKLALRSWVGQHRQIVDSVEFDPNGERVFYADDKQTGRPTLR